MKVCPKAATVDAIIKKMDTQTGRKKRQAESKGNEMGMRMGRVSVKSQAIMQWKCYNAFSAASVGQQTEKKT